MSKIKKATLGDALKEAKEDKAAPGVWVTTTYFAEGFPYTVVNTIAEALFKEFGANLKEIGLTSLFHLPWNLKFLWGPFLDAFETKRAWLVWIEVAITAVLVALALSATTSTVLIVASALFMLLAILSATHDIAIDGFYLEGLNAHQQSTYVGLRAAAYRAAMFVVSSPLLFLVGWVGWISESQAIAWATGLLAAAGMMALITAYHFTSLPRVENRGRPASELVKALLSTRTAGVALTLALAILTARAVWRSSPLMAAKGAVLKTWPAIAKLGTADWIALGLLGALVATALSLPLIKRALTRGDGYYVKAFVDFLDQPKVGSILAFIILFRVGESFLLKMRYAFLRDIGMSLEQIGIATGTVGLFASMGATLLGGWLIGKHGLKAWIWPMVIAQNTLNLLYMWLGSRHDTLSAAGGAVSFVEVTGVIGLEAIGSGLGTAIFMVYIMRCCKPDYKAAHMAILTALMSLGFTIAGVASGFIAESLGYTRYFFMTFIATLPGMVMIFFVPYLDGERAGQASE